MVAHFLKESAAMVGIDPHDYVTLPMIKVPTPHLVPVYSLGSPLEEAAQKTSRVTAEGVALLKGGATRIVTVHAPLTVVPPNPVLETLELASILSDAEAVMEMSAHKVTGQGKPLATTVLGPLGLIADCGVPLGLGVTIHSHSVKTQPTAGDYVGALVGVLSRVLLEILGDKIAGEGLEGELRKLLFELILRMLDVDDALDELPSPDKIHPFLQRWIDDGFDDAKKQWREDVKKAQEKRTTEKAEEAEDWKKRLEHLLKKLGGKEAKGGKKGKR